MKLVLSALAAFVVTALAVTLVFAGLFSRTVARLETRLVETAPGTLRTDLPEPVRAFAERNMMGADPVAWVRLEQSVEMRLQKGADWQPMKARQTDSMAEPGFAWVAVQKVGPVPMARVLDSYVAGAGLLEIRLLGAFRVGAYEGPEAALGEALRYLGELPWFPDAILTNREIRWSETAEGISAALDTAGGTASVTFSFDAAGDISGVLARDRPATMPDGSIKPLDWRGRLADYAEIGGRRIPTSGEVGYDYEDGYEAYWRGRITAYQPGP